jgi:hypothetical protein
MFSRKPIRSLWLALALLLPIVTGCERETLVGSYQATTFTFTETGSPSRDARAAGGSINLTIHDNMGTSGTLVVPGTIVSGSDISVSLLGDAAQQGDVVSLNLVVPSFLADMEFTFDGSTLTGTRTSAGVTVHVVLSK